MSSQELASLENALGHQFKDIELLREALRHSSYVNEQKALALRDNERLEFLGDAVLDLVISHMLMTDFPETREGDLSRMRATIVTNPSWQPWHRTWAWPTPPSGTGRDHEQRPGEKLDSG